jgi:hypothetical protein
MPDYSSVAISPLNALLEFVLYQQNLLAAGICRP